MTTLDDLTDDELDALLHGEQPAGADSLAPLRHVVASLRERTVAQPAPPMAPALRARLVARSAAVQAVPLSGRRAGVRAILSAAAVLLVAGLVGAGAARNALPDQVQNAVSSAAHLVGVEVPRADEASDAPGDRADATDATDATNARHRSDGTNGTNGTNGSDRTDRSARTEGTEGSVDTATDRARDDAGATPGGGLPAEPGTPGDGEPATPAVPPDRGGGNEGRAEPDPPRRQEDVVTSPPVDEAPTGAGAPGGAPLTSDSIDVRPSPQRSDRSSK